MLVNRPQLLFLALLAIIMLVTTGCGLGDDNDDDLLGNWIRRSDFEGIPRSNAVSFTIGERAYVGLGYDGDDDLRDFWSYDAELDFWIRVDSFPGVARRAAVAFSIGDRGYVGTGYNGDLEVEYRDFWSFNPNAAAGAQWTRIADFPGSARFNAVAFADESRGYVGSGFDDNWLKDFYAYDPATGNWEQIVSIGGSKRESAVAFTIDGLHYVGTGRNNGTNEFDFWRYDPGQDRWEQRLDLDEEDDYDVARQGAVAFTLNGMGYVTTGASGFNNNGVWEYNPRDDTWEEKTAFEGSARAEAVAFVINGRAFVTTGRAGSNRYDDIREFRPEEEADEDD